MSHETKFAPIGVFDSGVGGLSVLRSIRLQLLNEDVIFLADQAHVPYGPRTIDQVRDFSEAITYIQDHPEVRDVLLSGGDPLLFSDERLEHLLSQLRAIRHVEFLRIGTRIPLFLPQRITPELCAMLKKYQPLWMSIHTNHPREATSEVREACSMMCL